MGKIKWEKRTKNIISQTLIFLIWLLCEHLLSQIQVKFAKINVFGYCGKIDISSQQ